MARYSTALSHIVLASTGLFCLYKHDVLLTRASYGLLVINSAIGVWRWGNPDYGQSADKLYKLTSVLQDLFVLPCIVANVWLTAGYPMELAYCHIAVAVLPLMAYLSDRSHNNLTDTLLGANCVSLGAVSFLRENYFGVSSAISYAFNHFVIRKDCEEYFDVPSQDLYNYAMCFFAFFALRANSAMPHAHGLVGYLFLTSSKVIGVKRKYQLINARETTLNYKTHGI